ncbi:MAG: sigma-70 family RNA polymerase sigma factor [Thermofilaceae archaeon]
MNQKPPPFHHLLRDLPDELQKAVHEAVAACQPCFRPRLYASDWLEELYHEAACAACEAWRSYDPAKGSLYAWGLRLIHQRLQRFSDGVWAACRCEGEWSCDEETGEEVEVEDEGALEAIEEGVLCSQVREALARLSEEERQLLEWYFGEELREREIAARLRCSHVAVHKRLRSVWARLCGVLGVEREFPGRRGKKSPKKREKSE